jgi:hypothetical protein
MRWSLRLAEFNFDVENLAGTMIMHVDTLSRHLQTVTIDRTLYEDLLEQSRKPTRFLAS